MLRVWHSKSAWDLLHILPKAYLQRDHGHFFQFLGRKKPYQIWLMSAPVTPRVLHLSPAHLTRHIPNFRDCKEVFSLCQQGRRGVCLLLLFVFFFWLGCWFLVSFCQTGGRIAKTPWPFAAPNTHICSTGYWTRTALLVGAVVLITPAAISHECFNS